MCEPVELGRPDDLEGPPPRFWDTQEAAMRIAVADPGTGGLWIRPIDEIVVNVTQDDPERDAQLQALSRQWPVVIRRVTYSIAELEPLGFQITDALSGEGFAGYDPARNQLTVQLPDPETVPDTLEPSLQPPYDRFCIDPYPWRLDTPAADI